MVDSKGIRSVSAQMVPGRKTGSNPDKQNLRFFSEFFYAKNCRENLYIYPWICTKYQNPQLRLEEREEQRRHLLQSFLALQSNHIFYSNDYNRCQQNISTIQICETTAAEELSYFRSIFTKPPCNP